MYTRKRPQAPINCIAIETFSTFRIYSWSTNNHVAMANSMTMPVFVLRDGRAAGTATPRNRWRPFVPAFPRHMPDLMHGIGKAYHAEIGDDLEGVTHHLAGHIRKRRLKRPAGSAPGGHGGRGARNRSRSDEPIREAVCDGLPDHSWLNASSIEGAMNFNDVRLSNWAGSRVSADHGR